MAGGVSSPPARYADLEGAFLFLLTVLGVILLVILTLILVQEGKVR
jgi:hypothetical protein